MTLKPMSAHNGEINIIYLAITIKVTSHNGFTNRFSKIRLTRFDCPTIGPHVNTPAIGEGLKTYGAHGITR
ncbi:MAG: hypothetical protein JRJ51_21615, partial [Deltaproteobacteria bacterium]|nr:hypothetical protein [Deltaproteobacteria bacterium]